MRARRFKEPAIMLEIRKIREENQKRYDKMTQEEIWQDRQRQYQEAQIIIERIREERKLAQPK